MIMRPSPFVQIFISVLQKSFIQYLVSNNPTVSQKKRFNFENRVTFGEGQRMTLTFDTQVGSVDHLVQCMYQL